MYEIVTKILVPIFVGIVLKLVTIWLENRTRNKQVASNRCCLNSKRHPTTIGCLLVHPCTTLSQVTLNLS